ncbi:hypothetical protein A3H80_03860 [Candidatus Roizmanbacteria bacterium RIFCSPLOWO2_02_FULL_37_19]|uniref:Cytoplasmic protein n=1 Tax=Candidatus Roizmanbacteria bacterium RIFCSPHIGHO2_02_FULL_37_24 TaxID=1802037 RepID=A0A1F7GW45_9BACT|nr:MAG: hypothetical protein A2862_03820 [Candidatus Roizmanbacteria bacterium RIFCSPHIGHO2_01_FULL_38_41]OGK23300.1 MAG: hypothetical protein A3C24_03850 [Candidatus Roizmanbacteria bacterium RIFCSPHIGHO2_02_FULL_37_24]OGK32313.1 MAG: hypothetical protein A3E10_04090 [Candidatus Roizmanbacteria bacterium RIFCSPHIGHO2_12_FULL_37_23]OGK44563.1 MAG: hypothetical protein A2956_02630 [Candidatus Roizmanbacteria bacterium RIFCSPLOWO2_01_FULL_37_57]OGK54831.1 MAG: hypothetical protein A3H80_03860 [Ca
MNDTDARINRLMGQIEGIRRMINGGRKTDDVVQQIMAARQALSRIGILILKEELLKSSSKNQNKTKRILEKIFRI